MGGRWGGLGLYLLKGKPVFNYNLLMLAAAPLGRRRAAATGWHSLTPGKHTIVFDFTYDGPGIAKGGTGVLKVDGQDVATRKAPNTDSVPAAGSTRPSTSGSTPARR